MANIRSAKKKARQDILRYNKNIARRSLIKTVTKKVLEAIDENNVQLAQELLRNAESIIARAKGKKVIKRNTAANKISSLAKKVAASVKQSS
jgi:small subunit ribosomal protein S20